MAIPLFGINRMAPVQKSKDCMQLRPTVASRFQSASLSDPAKATSRQETLLVEEDFSKMTSGTEQNPDTTVYLASESSEPGIYINPAYTRQPGWAGNKVFSAGGAVFLRTHSLMDNATLFTPIGDYSGEITVTCRVKAVENKVLVYNEYGQLMWGTTEGSSLFIQAGIGGVESGLAAKTDQQDGYYTRLYPQHGWTTVTYTFTNYSGNNDGYIVFFTEGAIMLDDIKITTSPTIIGNPGGLHVADFRADQFTIEWQPVRKAQNYYVNLYKKVYTSEEDAVYKENFENYQPGELWNISSDITVDGVGKNGSKALKLENGDYIVTPYNSSKYKNFKFWMKTIYPEGMTEEEIYSGETGSIKIDILTKEGWKDYSYLYGWGFMYDEYNDCDLNEEGWGLFDNGSFYGVKLTFEGFPEGTSIYFDEAEVITDPSFELEFVDGRSASDWGFGDNMTKYDTTKETSYTFTNLDPNAEYFYGVRAHCMVDRNLFSQWKLYECFEVATPQTLNATDIDAYGSFTANWNPSPKATRYSVNLYNVYQTESIVDDYLLIDEDFENVSIDDSNDYLTLENYDISTLDDYTNLPGWMGKENIIANGMLGCNYSVYSINKICLPMINVGNGNFVTLTMKAYGIVDDCLIFNVDGVKYQLNLSKSDESDYGCFSGSVMIPVNSYFISPYIYSKNGLAFVIDELKISQDLMPGSNVYTWIQKVDVDADSNSYAFADLTEKGVYSYDVTAYYDRPDGKTAISKQSEMMIVDLLNGSSKSKINNIIGNGSESMVKAIYTIDGIQTQSLSKGLNIVVMSDGSVRRVFFK
ncbi:MAG: hypothetical protein ACI304_05930 [Lepagella sp.]